MKDKQITQLIKVAEEDLSLVDNSLLNAQQLGFLFKPTPKSHIHERPAKGGGKWKFVTGVYVKKVLNLMFGFNWSFEVVDFQVDHTARQVIVQGRLTCNTKGGSIIKMQFGRADIKYKVEWADGKKTQTNNPMDLGNDLKAATTDCLKKCASELGIAGDIYGANEFKAIEVESSNEESTDDLKMLIELFEEHGEKLKEEEIMQIERIIEEEEKSSYSKAIKILSKNE